MTTSIGNINAFSYGAVASSGTANKLYVPVSKSALLYSHFDHVSGVAAGSGQPGVSLNKLRIINSLIERVSAVKNESVSKLSALNPKYADELINSYAEQIHKAVSKNPYALSGAMPQAGDMFSFKA